MLDADGIRKRHALNDGHQRRLHRIFASLMDQCLNGIHVFEWNTEHIPALVMNTAHQYTAMAIGKGSQLVGQFILSRSADP